MNDKKFALHPGWVVSQYDGDNHWISSQQLARLYGIDWRKCAILSGPDDYGRKMAKNDTEYIHLFPQYDGNYKQFWLDNES